MGKRTFSGDREVVKHRLAPHTEAARHLANTASDYAKERETPIAVVEAFVAWVEEADRVMAGPTRAHLLTKFEWLADVGRVLRG